MSAAKQYNYQMARNAGFPDWNQQLPFEPTPLPTNTTRHALTHKEYLSTKIANLNVLNDELHQQIIVEEVGRRRELWANKVKSMQSPLWVDVAIAVHQRTGHLYRHYRIQYWFWTKLHLFFARRLEKTCSREKIMESFWRNHYYVYARYFHEYMEYEKTPAGQKDVKQVRIEAQTRKVAQRQENRLKEVGEIVIRDADTNETKSAAPINFERASDANFPDWDQPLPFELAPLPTNFVRRSMTLEEYHNTPIPQENVRTITEHHQVIVDEVGKHSELWASKVKSMSSKLWANVAIKVHQRTGHLYRDYKIKHWFWTYAHHFFHTILSKEKLTMKKKLELLWGNAYYPYARYFHEYMEYERTEEGQEGVRTVLRENQMRKVQQRAVNKAKEQRIEEAAKRQQLGIQVAPVENEDMEQDEDFDMVPEVPGGDRPIDMADTNQTKPAASINFRQASDANFPDWDQPLPFELAPLPTNFVRRSMTLEEYHNTPIPQENVRTITEHHQVIVDEVGKHSELWASKVQSMSSKLWANVAIEVHQRTGHLYRDYKIKHWFWTNAHHFFHNILSKEKWTMEKKLEKLWGNSFYPYARYFHEYMEYERTEEGQEGVKTVLRENQMRKVQQRAINKAKEQRIEEVAKRQQLGTQVAPAENEDIDDDVDMEQDDDVDMVPEVLGGDQPVDDMEVDGAMDFDGPDFDYVPPTSPTQLDDVKNAVAVKISDPVDLDIPSEANTAGDVEENLVDDGSNHVLGHLTCPRLKQPIFDLKEADIPTDSMEVDGDNEMGDSGVGLEEPMDQEELMEQQKPTEKDDVQVSVTFSSGEQVEQPRVLCNKNGFATHSVEVKGSPSKVDLSWRPKKAVPFPRFEVPRFEDPIDFNQDGSAPGPSHQLPAPIEEVIAEDEPVVMTEEEAVVEPKNYMSRLRKRPERKETEKVKKVKKVLTPEEQKAKDERIWQRKYKKQDEDDEWFLRNFRAKRKEFAAKAATMKCGQDELIRKMRVITNYYRYGIRPTKEEKDKINSDYP